MILGTLYFVDVFVGMLLQYSKYKNNYDLFVQEEQDYHLTDRPYDIIEIGLISLIVLETAFKIAFSSINSSNPSKEVRPAFNWLERLDHRRTGD